MLPELDKSSSGMTGDDRNVESRLEPSLGEVEGMETIKDEEDGTSTDVLEVSFCENFKAR